MHARACFTMVARSMILARFHIRNRGCLVLNLGPNRRRIICRRSTCQCRAAKWFQEIGNLNGTPR
jgi:hypothetical protein